MKALIVKSIGNYYNFLSLFSVKYASKKALTLFASPRGLLLLMRLHMAIRAVKYLMPFYIVSL